MSLLGPLACTVAPADGDDLVGETTAQENGDGDPSCPPGDPTVDFSYGPFEFPNESPMDPTTTFDETCTVASVNLGGALDLQLDCPDSPDPIAIRLNATPSLTFAPVLIGDALRVRYLFDAPFWINEYLRIDRVDADGERHLLTMVASETLQLDDPVYDLPLALQSASIPCEQVFDNCLHIERLALGFQVDGQPNELLDGSHALLDGETEIWIAAAVDYENSECTDSPEAWFEVLITNPQ